MNFVPNLFNQNVVVNPPIIHRRVNDIHRTFITEQPHIIEDQTRIFNHHILRHTCCIRPTCCEFNDCQVVNCCNVPGIVGPGCGNIGVVPGVGQGPMMGQMPGQIPGPMLRPRPNQQVPR
jgi:hypothetical protein